MEDAYTQLFQEFLRLRSVCLKQAALLRQLTNTLQQQPGPGPEPPLANPTGRHDANGTFYDLLTGDMSNLGLGVQVNRKQDVKVNHSSPLFLAGLNASSSASSSASQHPRQADHSARDTTPLQASRPQACRALLDSDFLGPPGMELMSELTLQSHVCEFCQAVFPGHTTTRGEFVRHLHTHT